VKDAIHEMLAAQQEAIKTAVSGDVAGCLAHLCAFAAACVAVISQLDDRLSKIESKAGPKG
jgi:hypothetical protein